MSRYHKEFWNDDIADPILTLATGGLNIVTKIAVDTLLPGPNSVKWFCKITDTKSGASATGSGYSKGEASADAWFKLTGKKDEKYKQQEEERKKKKEEWEKRQREREQKQKEWEERKKERERKQKEWETRKAERERKQKEWEERQKERERKKKEWEARQLERERKQREYEARKAERERKQREWEARQAERQRERERKQREWEERKAENERRQREWDERKRNRGSGGRKKGGGSGGCYITTAVCSSMNLPDDCHELQTIRHFRDNWLLFQNDGIKIISRYYETAPKIVESINKLTSASEIYLEIWKGYLEPFYQKINEVSNDEALQIYLKMVNNLEQEYLYKKSYR